MQEIHIGKIIKAELELQERTPTWLARKINCDRSNIYHIFERKSIDTDRLMQISRALNVNFFDYFKIEDDDLNGKIK